MLSVQRSMNVRGHRRSTSKAISAAAAFEVAGLERRLLMCLDATGHDDGGLDELPDDLGTYPAIHEQATVTAGSATPAAAGVALSSVPALSSHPTAYAKLYLDFNGDTTNSWGSYSPGTTPAYDTDGDPTTFSDAELASMREIFDRVAEKYSPLNIDVTTIDPGNLNNKQTEKVVIGGDGAWLGAQAGGVSYVGGFSNSTPNIAFVFPTMLANGYAQYVGEAAAHESGHGFGLQHQSSYDALGNKTEYAAANAAGDAPIMGNSYTARRGLWWSGTSTSPTTIQNDLTVLSSTTNGFGYRADDFGGTLATAAALTLSGTDASGAGVIERTSDADVFSFTSGAGSVNLFADPAAKGGMLDAKIDLRDANGTVLASADNGLAESLTATVTGGTYYFTVASHGGYGDLGQYTIHGTVSNPDPTTPPPQPTVPAAPSSLTARVLSTSSVRLTWTDNASDETGFKIFSSRDGVTWNLLGTVGANVTAVDNTGLRKNATYYYKVRAYNGVGDSADSNTASTKTSLTAATALKGDINLDGVVDFNDLVVLSQNYNTSVAITSGGNADVAWQQGDLNNDGVVDFDDLVLMSQNYNTGQPLASDTSGDDLGVITPVAGGSVATTTSTAAALIAPVTATTPKTTKIKAKPDAANRQAVFSVKPIARPASHALVARSVHVAGRTA